MIRMLGRVSVLMLAASCFLFAQRGGGGGGHHGAVSGGHASFHSAGSSNVSGFNINVNPNGIRGNSDGFNMNIQPGNLSGAVGYGSAARPRPPINGPRPVYGGYRPARYGYPLGLAWYPYLPLGYYDSGYDAQQEAPYYYEQAPYAEQPPQAPEYYQYPQVPYRQEPQPQAAEPAQPAPPLSLVLKNGQKLQVQSYAIMNGMFWDFTKANPKRIALADIDVQASAKATDEAGAAFPIESFAANPN